VIVALSGAILLAASQAVSAYPFSASAFELLPRHCKAWYASMLTVKRRPELSQIGPDAKRKYRVAYWRKQMGKGWNFANHYCPGVLKLTWVEFPSTASPKARKKSVQLLKEAKDAMEYQLSLTPWTKNNVWLKADVYSRLGKIASLRGDRRQAIQEYEQAIKLDPKKTTYHLALASEFESFAMYDEAISALNRARAIKPESKAIARRLAKYEKEAASAAGQETAAPDATIEAAPSKPQGSDEPPVENE
jgi:tetratricopeptide (TPR) repeat protein